MTDNIVTSLADARAKRAERAERARAVLASGDPLLDGIEAIVSRFAGSVLDATATLNEQDKALNGRVRQVWNTTLGCAGLLLVLLRHVARSSPSDAEALARDIRYQAEQRAMSAVPIKA